MTIHKRLERQTKVIGSGADATYQWIDHALEAPVDHSRPDGATITVFAREVFRSGATREGLPMLLYLQGGPGNMADRPNIQTRWLRRATADFRVLLLDQRGTGKSAPVSPSALIKVGNVAQQGEYLTNFRADSIVKDAELFRRSLCGSRKWFLLGQSFGGWCATTYLSWRPEALDAVFITGGLPSLDATPEDVYRAANIRVIERNREYFECFPEDVQRVALIAEALDASNIRLPQGERLSVQRFQELGMQLGLTGGFLRVHFLIDLAFEAGSSRPDFGPAFLDAVEVLVSHRTKPLFCLLQEAVHCQKRASRWAAQRVREEFQHDYSDPKAFFGGEMIYPWHFVEDPGLRPMQEVAEWIANYVEWPMLYDASRLASNPVPVFAALYRRDLFVDYTMSHQTLMRLGSAQSWVSQKLEHDGLRTAPVLDHLMRLWATRHSPQEA